MENIIEFQIVSKSFGDLKVLNNLNLQVKDGEKLYHSFTTPANKTRYHVT